MLVGIRSSDRSNFRCIEDLLKLSIIFFIHMTLFYLKEGFKH